MNKRDARPVHRVKQRRRKGEELPLVKEGGVDAGRAPLLDEHSVPPGAGIRPAVARQVLALQASRGNQHVQRSLSEEDGRDSGQRSTGSGAEDLQDTRTPRNGFAISERASGVNRIGLLSGLVTASALGAQMAERKRMLASLTEAGGGLVDVREQLKRLEEEDARAESDEVVEEMWEWIAYLNRDEPDEDFIHVRTAIKDFIKEVKKADDRGLMRIAAKTWSSLSQFTESDTPELSGVLPDLQEAAHFAFIEGSEDNLQPAVDAVDKVTSLQKDVAKVLEWAKDAAKLAKAAETVADIESAIGRVKGAGGVLGKLSKVARSAHAVATISGLDNKAAASYQSDINDFEAALDIIDVTGVIDAVPLLGSLWSEYYVPAAKRSLEMLRDIGRIRDVEGRTWGFIRFQETGKLPKGTRKFFPGGEPVLRFMLATMRDEEPKATANVKKFFLEKQSLFNVPFEGGTNELESEGGGIFDGEEKLTNLVSWVKLNKHLVWAMLYGSFEI